MKTSMVLNHYVQNPAIYHENKMNTQMQIQTQKIMQSEDFAEKIARAKQLFNLYNEITFGDEDVVKNSRAMLSQLQ